MGAVKWATLTRDDLRTFDGTATKLVLKAMELGAQGRISSKGHAILRATGGQTMSVSRRLESGSRAGKNTLAQFNRTFGPFDAEVPDVPEQRNGTGPDFEYVSPTGRGDLIEAVAADERLHPTLDCPLEGCEAVFSTEGGRYSHVEKNHDKCTEPGCQFVAKNKTGRLAHERAVHQGVAARRGTGKVTRYEGALDAIAAALKEVGRLPDDGRVAELEKENASLRKSIDELEAKIALIKEGLGL